MPLGKSQYNVQAALLLVRAGARVAIMTTTPETFVTRFAPYPDVEVKSWGVELKLQENNNGKESDR